MKKLNNLYTELQQTFQSWYFDNISASAETQKILQKINSILKNIYPDFKITNETEIKDKLIKSSQIQSNYSFLDDINLPFDLLIELMAESHSIIDELLIQQKKNLVSLIISDPEIFEKLFIAVGMHQHKDFKNEIGTVLEYNNVINKITNKKKPGIIFFITQKALLPLSLIMIILKRTLSGFVSTTAIIKRFFIDYPKQLIFTSLAVCTAGIFTWYSISNNNSGAEVLNNIGWNFKKDNKYLIKREGIVHTFHNNILAVKREEINELELDCREVSQEKADFLGIFNIYIKKGKDLDYELQRNYQNNFSIRRSGEYLISNLSLLPNLRSIPTFPDKYPVPGERWKKPFQLYFYDVNPAFMITNTAKYIYLSNISINNTNIAVIAIEFKILNKNLMKDKANSDITGIMIDYKSYLYWDLDNNLLYKQLDTINEILTLKNNVKIKNFMQYTTTLTTQKK